jgi:iron complex outermembrane receptor protein
LLACYGEPSAGNCPIGLAPPAPGFPNGASGLDYHTSRATTRDIGLYGQATYAITSKLNFTAGFRYTWDKTEDLSQYMVFNQHLADGSIDTSKTLGTFSCVRVDNVDPNNCVSRLIQNSHAPTWLISLDYKPIDNVMVYAKWARGYRTGGVYPTAPVGLETFNPEKVDTFEIGAKTGWSGPVPGSFNVAAFYNNFRNQQLQVGFQSEAAPPTAALVNAGKSRIYGIEADLHVRPFAGFRIDANYAYLNTRVQRIQDILNCYGVDCTNGYDGNALNYKPVGGISVGDPLLLAPKHKVAVTGTYTLPLSKDIGRIDLGATYTYQSSQLSNYSDRGICWISQLGDTPNCSSNFARVPGYGLLNLNVNWTSVGGKPLDLAFFMTNVTKKKYYSYFAGTLGYGFETSTVGAPQMYGVSAKVHF